MAIEKSKKVKETTTVQKKATPEKETAKKAPVKKEEEKAPVSEVKKPKKAVAKSEENVVAENITAAPVEKKTSKAKTAAEKKQPVAKEAIAKQAQSEDTNTKPSTKKSGSIIDTLSSVASTIVEAIVPSSKPEAVTVEDNQEQVAEQQKLKVTFQLKYTTNFGERLVVSANSEAFGNGDIDQALPLQYFNHEYWYAEVELDSKAIDAELVYNYYLLNENGVTKKDGANDRVLNQSILQLGDVLVVDTWVDPSYENNLYSEPAVQVEAATSNNTSTEFSHTFKVKAPVLPGNHAIFIAGNVEELGSWTEENIKLLVKGTGNTWEINLDLNKTEYPVVYKYGVYNLEEKKIVEFEMGENRAFYGSAEPKNITIISDGFAALSLEKLKMAV